MLNPINGRTAEALEKTAAIALSAAKAACPVRTGKLRDSIHSEINGNTAVISADTDYAAFVEFGTGKTAPRPFMQNGITAAATAAIDIYRKTVLEELIN